jgi:hypothetical protein
MYVEHLNKTTLIGKTMEKKKKKKKKSPRPLTVFNSVISFLSSAVLAIFFFMTGPNNLLNASRPNSYKEIELELTVTVALRVASLDIKQLAPKKSPVVNVFT